MAGSVNKVILIGHLGRDPEIRTTQDGGLIAQLSIATSESWKDRQTGEKRERTEWHRVVIFNEPLAKLAEQYLRKGAKVYVEGQLQSRKWTDSQGVERTVTEVVLARYRGELAMLDRQGTGALPPAGSQDDYGTSRSRERAAATAAAATASQAADFDDEIPF